ncbi:MAG: acyl-CoA thioesterase [bacterium]
MKLHSIINTRVRYAETDQMGVVYHSNYYHYMEIGRTDYLRKRGMNYSEIEHRGYYMFVTETHCYYKKPAKFEEKISIETILEKLGGASLNYKYIIRNESEELLAEGYTKHAFTTLKGKPTKIPQEIKDILTKKIDDSHSKNIED